MKEPAKVDGLSKKWIKIFLCMICTMLCYLGVLLFAISTVSKFQYEQLVAFMDIRMYRGILFLFIVGTLSITLAFVGFLGTWKESQPMLYTLCSLLAVFSLMEGTVAFFGYTQRHTMETDMDSNLWFSVNQYSEDISLQPHVDYLQMELKCCGVQNYTDWLMAMPSEDYADEDNDLVATLVPLSCCDPLDNVQCTIFKDGCYSRLYEIFYDTGKMVLMNTLAAVMLQIFGAMFAFYLQRKLRFFKDSSFVDQQHTTFDYSKMHSFHGSTEKV